jgi:short-subunit dehydrogenase
MLSEDILNYIAMFCTWQGAKAGVLQFFDTLRVEEKDSLAAVTIVMPGLTESEATGGKLVDEKGGMVQDTQRRDVSF